MSATRLWPKFHVMRQTEEGWEYAKWPDGEPIWRTCRDPERGAQAAIRDCMEAAERDPEGTYIVIDPDRSEIYRAVLTSEEAPF